MVTIESVSYAGWPDCLRLSTDHMEVVCTTRVGPRIVHVGLAGGANCCHLTEDAGTEPDDGEWHLFGGHRLWHAPELDGRTNQPDNDPVAVERHAAAVTLTQPTEPATGITKALTIELATSAPAATVTHQLVNDGPWPIEIAPWAITVLEPGGTAVLPIAERGEGRSADRSLSLWPYTDPGDDRFTFGDDAVLVDGTQGDHAPTKIGVDGHDGWLAYVLDGLALRKEFVRRDGASYADGGAAQVFTDGTMLEIETLGPLERIEPGEATTHVEEWALFEVNRTGTDVVTAVEP